MFEFETIKLAAGCGNEDTCTFLADHFDMSREELIEHLLDSCTQAGDHMVEWLDNRVNLTKEDVLGSSGLVGSTFETCVIVHRCVP